MAVPEVVVIGGGFGGLRLARELRGAPVHVTLIDRQNYHLFQPLLYQVATAGLSPTDIAFPLRKALRGQRNVDVRMADVQRIDLAGRRLTDTLGDVPFDHLVLAVGGETSYFGNTLLEETAFGLKSLDDATRIRNHILWMFEVASQQSDPQRRRELLTFVVVGGGPTGVECAGALSELIRLVLARDYPRLNLKDVRVLLLEAADRLLPVFPAGLRAHAEETLWRKHIEVRFGACVEAFNGRQLGLRGGETIPTHTVIWAAGVSASPLVRGLGLPVDRLGRLVTEPTLALPGHPNVFALGDCACPGGDPAAAPPMVAPAAIQAAVIVAENIRRSIRHAPLVPFRYRDPGSLATIGRNAAVTRLGALQFKGFLAWVLWLIVHLITLIGFRNRILVLINWAHDYFFYDRAVRLIMHDGRCPMSGRHGCCLEVPVLEPAVPAATEGAGTPAAAGRISHGEVRTP